VIFCFRGGVLLKQISICGVLTAGNSEHAAGSEDTSDTKSMTMITQTERIVANWSSRAFSKLSTVRLGPRSQTHLARNNPGKARIQMWLIDLDDAQTTIGPPPDARRHLAKTVFALRSNKQSVETAFCRPTIRRNAGKDSMFTSFEILVLLATAPAAKPNIVLDLQKVASKSRQKHSGENRQIMKTGSTTGRITTPT
jgi:hypothetical protein